MLQEVDKYLRAHWKFAAPVEPIFAVPEGALAAQAPMPATEDEKLIGPLLARARWSLIRRETRREQQARVAASPECHTRAFADFLLSELSAAGSRDEAEFIAHLALRAAEGMTESAAFTEDFLARVWTEVANVRRIAAEWNHAQAALRRMDEHLVRGSGDPLLKGRARSVAASQEAFLDILYLFGFHLRRGATEKAVALCRFAIAQLDLYGVGHEQLRAVWKELVDAAQRRDITLESLAEAREFFKVHWKKPAAKVPHFSFRSRMAPGGHTRLLP